LSNCRFTKSYRSGCPGCCGRKVDVRSFISFTAQLETLGRTLERGPVLRSSAHQQQRLPSDRRRCSQGKKAVPLGKHAVVARSCRKAIDQVSRSGNDAQVESSKTF